MLNYLRKKFSPPPAPRIIPRLDGISAYLWPEEEILLTAFLKSARRYVEFGSGGSTIIACETMRGEVISVDSSLDWQADITERLTSRRARIKPHLCHADIGPVGAWGWPIGETHKELWPRYYTAVWPTAPADEADLYLIDGRFRVACFMEIASRCTVDATILVHDFQRPEYQIMTEVGQEIARARTMVAFRKRSDISHDHVRAIQADFRYDQR